MREKFQLEQRATLRETRVNWLWIWNGGFLGADTQPPPSLDWSVTQSDSWVLKNRDNWDSGNGIKDIKGGRKTQDRIYGYRYSDIS